MPIDQLAPEDTLRADLAAQFDAWDAGNESRVQGDTSAGESPATEPSGTEPQASDAGDDRPRNPDGTFKAKTESEAAPQKAAPVTPELPTQDKPVKASEAPSTASAPPTSWSAAEKAEWPKLSPVSQMAISRRESEMANGQRQWSEQRQTYERVLNPLAQEAARLGMSTEQGLQSLLAAHHALNNDPVNAIRHLARQYGVDLANLAGQPPVSRETDPTQSQPDISALVRQAMQPYIAPLQERFAAEDRRQQEMTLASVTTFAESPGHEHFDAVQNEIMALIPHIKRANPSFSNEQVLNAAYDSAVYANPQTRAALTTAAAEKAEEERRAQARAHANGARRAASSVTGAAPGPAASGPKDSLRDEIIAAMAGES